MTDGPTSDLTPTPGRPMLGHGTAGLTARRPAPWSDALRDLEPPPRPAQPASAEPPALGKHCWYDGPHGRQPALLLEWARNADGHHRGRVAAPVPDGAGGWIIVETWVDQDVLSSAYSPPPSS